ncbi:FAD:protein FMN transferase [Collinsella sp. An2]|uniref:FAD:protein FMN transferase n=1 Tax=Collinsella sp. An2 TaxID=1965585 RepID=UPI000B3AFECA|nr:FAD:protein FMN transferase [Collinsella sp. An2]OUP06412.1 hypothetical protein B5F33_10240 [Collinsella sp. An2]
MDSKTADLSACSISRRRLLAGGAALAGALCSTALASGCSSNKPTAADDAAEPATSSTFAFDTYCTFTVYGDSSAPALLARECARYDKLFDLYDPESDIARVNAAGGAPTEVDPDTADIVQQAIAWCAQANGRFDITIGAVSTLWDFEEGVRPTDEAIAEALVHVDWEGVAVDTTDPEHPTITLADPAAKLDLGGIAKGYIADRLCQTLGDETQATGAALSLGGNIAYFGSKPDGSPWETGIRDPNDPGGSTVVGTTRTNGGSLVTSGLYERTFTLDGVTYWHILDPRTGMPVETDVASVTVCCPSSTQADALSTTLFVAGSVDGAQLADAYDDTAAFFVLRDNSTAETSRWQELTDFTAS